MLTVGQELVFQNFQHLYLDYQIALKGLFQFGASSIIPGNNPDYVICPSTLMDLKTGLLLVEVEYYIFQNLQEGKQRKLIIICSEQQKEALKNFLTLSLFGPISSEEFSSEFHTTYQAGSIPNLQNETKIFYKSCFNLDDELQIETFVDFLTYDLKLNQVQIDNWLTISFEDEAIVFSDEDTVIYTMDKELCQNILIEAMKRLNDEAMLEKKYHQSIRLGPSSSPSLLTFREELSISDLSVEVSFIPPLFGVTPLCHPFIQSKTLGLLLWINGRAALIDPPIFTKQILAKLKITPRLVDWVILTNSFTYNDMGLIQRLIQSQRLEIITTPTILKSFLQKFSLLTGHQPELMRKLVKFKPVLIGAIINLNGAILRFSYGYSYGPTLQFEIGIDGKQILYSGYSYFNPREFLQQFKKGNISQKRYEMLSNQKWVQNLIFLQGGNEQWKTPWKVFQDFPNDVINKITILDANLQDLKQHIVCQNSTVNSTATLVLEIKKNKALEYISKLDVLSQMEIFETLTLKNLRDLLEVAQSEEFSPGQIILKEGTIANKWYIIMRGVAQIITKNTSWERQFTVGDYFGETALIESDKEMRRMASVEAITSVTVLTLQKHDFWCTFGQDSESAGNRILKKMMTLYSSRKTQGFEALLTNKGLLELSQSQQMQFEMMMKERKIQKDVLVWKEADEAKFVGILFQGQMKLTYISNQQEIIIEKGMFVGDIEAILLDSPHITQLEALTDSVIFTIDSEEFISYLKRNPGFFITYGQVKSFQ